MFIFIQHLWKKKIQITLNGWNFNTKQYNTQTRSFFFYAAQFFSFGLWGIHIKGVYMQTVYKRDSQVVRHCKSTGLGTDPCF